MKANFQDRARLEAEIQRLVEQLKAMGATKVILFGSLARGQISLFSDITSWYCSMRNVHLTN
jgi:predicted nucleotidyltransferase